MQAGRWYTDRQMERQKDCQEYRKPDKMTTATRMIDRHAGRQCHADKCTSPGKNRQMYQQKKQTNSQSDKSIRSTVRRDVGFYQSGWS
jgi:hypothetical protein